ncbi:hypothetical protein HY418_00495 [Candidatus Kaiserbacteria bacterium]|nr:hypothetical protein [Candidatus Kaiserbacteria bacterium]
MSKKRKEHIAVKMTESARGNVFINSQINGGLELAGQDNNFIETKIGEIKQKHPVWFWVTVMATLIGIVTGLMFLGQFFGVLPPSFQQNISLVENKTLATTTPNLLDIYEAAFKYDILADRQEFFRKYIDSRVYGDGTIREISSLGDRYILEIDIGRYSILCPQEETDDIERSYPLLKGKKVRFYGTFTYSNYFGYDGNALAIDECSFERK